MNQEIGKIKEKSVGKKPCWIEGFLLEGTLLGGAKTEGMSR